MCIRDNKQTLEFFGLDSEDENNQKRLRDLENGQCLMQDLYGRVGVVQIHPVFEELLHAFDTRPPVKRNEVEMCIRDRDIQHIIKDILKLNINYMLHEDYGHYSYTEHYSLGDIFIYTSADEEKGVLLELKGRGCRQFESYLLAQQRSWYDFLMDALIDGGVMKRIDLDVYFKCRQRS